MTTQTQKSLYDRDFYLWIETTAKLLRDRKFNQIDLDNLIEEIESMGRSEKRELKSRLTVLLMHLLKWEYQQEMRSNSWKATIVEQRYQIKLLLEDSPSLKNLISDAIPDCYEGAVLKASAETGLSKNSFPEQCPFSVEEIIWCDF
jgi:hypothetical protein